MVNYCTVAVMFVKVGKTYLSCPTRLTFMGEEANNVIICAIGLCV